jgi:hypothetical protein
MRTIVKNFRQTFKIATGHFFFMTYSIQNRKIPQSWCVIPQSWWCVIDIELHISYCDQETQAHRVSLITERSTYSLYFRVSLYQRAKSSAVMCLCRIHILLVYYSAVYSTSKKRREIIHVGEKRKIVVHMY